MDNFMGLFLLGLAWVFFTLGNLIFMAWKWPNEPLTPLDCVLSALGPLWTFMMIWYFIDRAYWSQVGDIIAQRVEKKRREDR